MDIKYFSSEYLADNQYNIIIFICSSSISSISICRDFCRLKMCDISSEGDTDNDTDDDTGDDIISNAFKCCWMLFKC